MNDPEYMAIRLRTETLIGEVVRKTDNVVTLTKVYRVNEISLPERSALGQIHISVKPSVLPLIPTEPAALPNEVPVPVTQIQWSTLLTKEQFDSFTKCISPDEEEKPKGRLAQ